MIRIELTQEEQQVLREVIENSLTDLRVENVSTHRLEFKGPNYIQQLLKLTSKEHL